MPKLGIASIDMGLDYKVRWKGWELSHDKAEEYRAKDNASRYTNAGLNKG